MMEMTTAVTQGATKELDTISGMKLYHLTGVGDGYVLDVPFGTVTNVISCNRSSTATVYVTVSGSRLTFNVSSATPDVDVMVWGY
jgi:hypothetical protein